jgi:hypothetical protein
MSSPKLNSHFKKLYLFVSSPADCSVYRSVVRSVIQQVNKTEAARRAQLQIKPILWEDMPPGPAEPNNLQLRINEIMKNYGLNRYHIYVGMMSHRIGTPTSKALSGTIEEFQGAIASRRRSGLPQEILFYFLVNPNKPEDRDVRIFRNQIGRNGYLYAQLTPVDFEEKLRLHLTSIVQEWYTFSNRIRRGIAYWRPVAVMVALVTIIGLLLVYAKWDRGGAERIFEGFEQASVAELLQRWERANPYILIHRNATRNRLNDIITDRIQTADLIRAIEIWKLWVGQQNVHDKVRLEDVRSRLIGRVRDATNARFLYPDPDAVTTEWRMAVNSSLMAAWGPESRDLLGRIITHRMLMAFLVLSPSAVEEQSSLLMPGERERLRRHAQAIIKDMPSNSAWRNQTFNIILAKIASDSLYAEMLADEEIATSKASYVAVTFFIKSAPNEQIVFWLERHSNSSLSVDILNAIEQGLAQRDSTASSVPVQLYVSRFATKRSKSALPSEMLDVLDESFLIGQLTLWCKNRRFPSAELLRDVLYRVDLSLLSAPCQSGLACHIISSIDSDDSSIITPESFLWQMDSLEGWTYLDLQLKAHLSGSTSYGYKQKAGLLRALSVGPWPRASEFAESILRIAWEEVESNDRIPLSSLNDVAAAYLDFVAKRGWDEWNRHKFWVERIIRERIRERARERFPGLFMGIVIMGDYLGEIYDGDYGIDSALREVIAKAPSEIAAESLALPANGQPVLSESGRKRLELIMSGASVPAEAWPKTLCKKITTVALAFHIYDEKVVYGINNILAHYPMLRSWYVRELSTLDPGAFSTIIKASENKNWKIEQIRATDNTEPICHTTIQASTH